MQNIRNVLDYEMTVRGMETKTLLTEVLKSGQSSRFIYLNHDKNWHILIEDTGLFWLM